MVNVSKKTMASIVIGSIGLIGISVGTDLKNDATSIAAKTALIQKDTKKTEQKFEKKVELLPSFYEALEKKADKLIDAQIKLTNYMWVDGEYQSKNEKTDTYLKLTGTMMKLIDQDDHTYAKMPWTSNKKWDLHLVKTTQSTIGNIPTMFVYTNENGEIVKTITFNFNTGSKTFKEPHAYTTEIGRTTENEDYFNNTQSRGKDTK